MSSTNPITVLGIRHHGPGSARALLRALDELRPDAILVEGPPDADELITWAGEPGMQPPLALLVYQPDQPDHAVYYPFAEFSPEWQALRYALAHGIPARFMDLPQAAQFNNISDAALSGSPDNAASEIFPDPLAWLARAAGYDDGERWWEHLVEARRAAGLDQFAGVLEMMTVARAELEGDAGPANPREARREAHMRQSIRAALAEGKTRLAIVCGAWHAPVLADTLSRDPATDAALLKDLPRVKTAAAWVPWSNGRLAWESGYGAGIASPGWYELLWQAGDGPEADELPARWAAQAARLLRQQDLGASSAHVIETVRLAETLAALRGQSRASLSELVEAARAVMCFGSDLPLRLVREKLIVGERLGSVSESAPVTPLQADLARAQKRLRLPAEALVRDLDLDLREPTGLERSRLLHRLTLLEVPWGDPVQVGGKRGTFHEFWKLEWRPELAVKLVEASLWGNTVEEAAANRARQVAENAPALPVLAGLVQNVLLADLPGALEAILARLDAAAALASDTGELMDTLTPLAEALRYGGVRQFDANVLTGVIHGLVARICIGLGPACASLDDDAAAELFTRVTQTQAAIALLEDPALSEPWQAALAALADQSGVHGLLAGRACVLLLEAGLFSPEETARRLGLALSSASDPAAAAAWVEGLLRGSGTLLAHQDALWGVIDAWVSGLPADRFVTTLPLLRRTFSTFAPAERRLLGERARRGAATRPAISGVQNDFNPASAEAVLATLARMLGLQDPQAGPQEAT